MKAAILFAASAVLVAGCTPVLLRHYETLDPRATAPQVELSVFLANPKASDRPTVISGLGERAQAELIRSLASKMAGDSEPADLLVLLQKTPDDPPRACGWATRKSATKKLVLTVLGDLPLPADRLDKLNVTLKLNRDDRSDKRAAFVSWDHFDSVYGKFDIGTAKYTQSGKVSMGRSNTDVSNLPSSAGSVTKVLNLGAEASNALEESASYALRRMSIGGALTPTSAQLVQEGGPNINLFGSSVATITLSLKPLEDPIGLYSFVLTRKNGALAPADVTVERCRADYPISSDPITVVVTANALLRTVNRGDGTVSEADDGIALKNIALTPTPSLVPLLTTADLKLERYALVYCDRGAKLQDCTRLHIEYNGVQNNGVEQVLMPTMDAAVKLRTWLVAQSNRGTLSAINGLAIGLASKEAATSDSMSASALAGLATHEANRLRVALLPDSE